MGILSQDFKVTIMKGGAGYSIAGTLLGMIAHSK